MDTQVFELYSYTVDSYSNNLCKSPNKIIIHCWYLFYVDLAIGAPYDEKGAVYIYLGSPKGLVTEPSQVIRIDDLAKEVRNRRDLRTFGYSLSGGLDLDDNGYPDLLVGAYDSDSVVLLRLVVQIFLL